MDVQHLVPQSNVTGWFLEQLWNGSLHKQHVIRGSYYQQSSTIIIIDHPWTSSTSTNQHELFHAALINQFTSILTSLLTKYIGNKSTKNDINELINQFKLTNQLTIYYPIHQFIHQFVQHMFHHSQPWDFGCHGFAPTTPSKDAASAMSQRVSVKLLIISWWLIQGEETVKKWLSNYKYQLMVS